MFRYLPLFTSLVAATNLYATHYSGTVYSLLLDQADDGEYSLSIASRKTTCGGMPSWLTFDSLTRQLYCSDETGDATTNGTLSSYYVDENGKLLELAKTVDVGGGVNSVIYEDEDGEKYLAIAHYSGSALSTFPLPLRDNAPILQTLRYNTSPGIKPQQDSSHPHQVILDPTGSFILSPDLGADVVRVYAIDKSSGLLDECPSLNYVAGSGPRHGLFWESNLQRRRSSQLQVQGDSVNQSPEAFLYTVCELSGHLHAFAVSYPPSGCLAFEQTQDFVPYKNQQQLPAGATPAEIHQVGSNLYVSIRTDHGFPPNDSISTLARGPDGTVTFSELTSSYGTVPRTFVINKAGTLVAIADQASSNVAIVTRDPESGKLGEEVANLQVGLPGTVGTSTGLSSIVWDE